MPSTTYTITYTTTFISLLAPGGCVTARSSRRAWRHAKHLARDARANNQQVCVYQDNLSANVVVEVSAARGGSSER